MRVRSPGWVLVVVFAIAISSCGDDNASSSAPDATEIVSTPSDASTGDASNDGDSVLAPEGIDVPEGVPLVDGLIPELTAIPMPAGPAAYQLGSAFTAQEDPRETAVQSVMFTQSVEEVIAFFLEELPKAGFTLDEGGITELSQVKPNMQLAILFTDPVGLPGNISISPGAFSASQININLFRSGVR